MTILQFMSDSPVLTFFLAGFAAQAIVGLANAIFGGRR